MFVCHTPPFRKRGRRGFERSWRSCSGGHSYHRHHSSGAAVVHEDGPFYPLGEIMDTQLEDAGNEYCFRRATPGIPAEQWHVDVQGPVLTVRALTEIPGQRFKWRVAIPDDVYSDCITAEIQDGILNVRLPKKPPGGGQDLWKLENWGSEYRLTHPVHGAQPPDVAVTVEEGFLFVAVRHPDGDFSRELSLPPAVDADAIAVEIENGMLTVILPKYERDEIRVHCHHGSGGSSSNTTFSEDEDATSSYPPLP